MQSPQLSSKNKTRKNIVYYTCMNMHALKVFAIILDLDSNVSMWFLH